MGRWRYLNLLVLLACAVFLYLGLFTARSPLVPKPLGAVVRAEQALGPWTARLGHGESPSPGQRVVVQVRFCPRCYRAVAEVGLAVAGTQPAGLDAPGVAPLHGEPHRRSAAVTVPDTVSPEALSIWLGARGVDGVTHWARWPLRPPR